jgi:hypothetical protein
MSAQFEAELVPVYLDGAVQIVGSDSNAHPACYAVGMDAGLIDLQIFLSSIKESGDRCQDY